MTDNFRKGRENPPHNWSGEQIDSLGRQLVGISRKQLAKARALMGFAPNDGAKLSRTLVDGTRETVKLMSNPVKGGRPWKKVITEVPLNTEEIIRMIFSCNWAIQYNGLPSLIDDNLHEYSVASKPGSTWSINTTEYAQHQSANYANWFSSDGKTILSWSWPQEFHSTQGDAHWIPFPYGASRGPNSAIYSQGRYRVFEDIAPDRVLGAAYIEGLLIAATVSGVYYRDSGGGWNLISGTASLISHITRDTPAFYGAVRFSGSGTKAISHMYYGSVYDIYSIEMEFSVAGGVVSLASSSTDTADFNGDSWISISWNEDPVVCEKTAVFTDQNIDAITIFADYYGDTKVEFKARPYLVDAYFNRHYYHVTSLIDDIFAEERFEFAIECSVVAGGIEVYTFEGYRYTASYDYASYGGVVSVSSGGQQAEYVAMAWADLRSNLVAYYSYDTAAGGGPLSFTIKNNKHEVTEAFS